VERKRSEFSREGGFEFTEGGGSKFLGGRREEENVKAVVDRSLDLKHALMGASLQKLCPKDQRLKKQTLQADPKWDWRPSSYRILEQHSPQ
jgi:hypothetical protein